jgi:hypothetical protein
VAGEKLLTKREVLAHKNITTYPASNKNEIIIDQEL